MQRAWRRSTPAGPVFMRRSRRWTRRRVPFGAIREDRSVYVGARAERRRSCASRVAGSAYVIAAGRLRTLLRRFYVDLVADLRQSYEGWRDGRAAPYSHAVGAPPPTRWRGS